MRLRLSAGGAEVVGGDALRGYPRGVAGGVESDCGGVRLGLSAGGAGGAEDCGDDLTFLL